MFTKIHGSGDLVVTKPTKKATTIIMRASIEKRITPSTPTTTRTRTTPVLVLWPRAIMKALRFETRHNKQIRLEAETTPLEKQLDYSSCRNFRKVVGGFKGLFCGMGWGGGFGGGLVRHFGVCWECFGNFLGGI